MKMHHTPNNGEFQNDVNFRRVICMIIKILIEMTFGDLDIEQSKHWKKWEEKEWEY